MGGLIERLRRAATACEEWPLTEPPPLTAWATLMAEAADALETEEDIDFWIGDKEESDG
jgi:hypothetical protein